MQATIDLNTVSSKRLRDGYYEKTLPEYYALKNVTENGLWHVNQNVFDHVVAVFAGLEKVLRFEFVGSVAKKRIEEYLDKKVGFLTKREVLVACTVLHDIAKSDCVITRSDGSAGAPGHEIIGSQRVVDYSKRFGFNKEDEGYAKKIVEYHGFTNDILTQILFSKNQQKYFEVFKGVVGESYIELALLMYADILGSDLKKSNEKEFEDRLGILRNFLEIK